MDTAFIPLCRILNSISLGYCMPDFVEQVDEPLHYEHDDTKVIVFSGGKVSLACALRYKDIGHKIVLYHVPEAGEDVSRIKQISVMLDAPLYIADEVLSVTPFSGIILLAYALAYAVSHSYSPKIVFGYFDWASISDNPRKDWAYCREFVLPFRDFGRKCVDGFSILNPIPNYAVMWDELLGHKRYLQYVGYKDEIEQMVFQNIRMDYYLDEPNKELYLHNIEYLKSIWDNRRLTLNELWNKYFFYRIEKSRFYKELMELSR